MPFPRLSRGRLAIGVAVVIGLVVVGGIVWGFGQQLALAAQMRAEEARLEAAVATEQARHDQLVSRLERVQSDDYVERWARAEARMARPGEVVAIPVPDEDVEPAPEAQPEESVTWEPQPFWARWWQKVFGAAEQP